jgi:hypothetical protein
MVVVQRRRGGCKFKWQDTQDLLADFAGVKELSFFLKENAVLVITALWKEDRIRPVSMVAGR